MEDHNLSYHTCGGKSECHHAFREEEDLRHSHGGNSSGRMSSAAGFRINIRDEGPEYLLEAELPGFQKNEIKIDVGIDTMTISAERKATHTEEDGYYIRCERQYGAFSRSFDLTGIRAEAITARYENGVLCVTLPKKSGYDTPTRRLNLE